jgi:hypothetical protein
VDGKKAGSDINLYKLFAEQCYRLLRKGGYCGIVIPSGIYTDLGTKQLREMLFAKTRMTGLFCFENRKAIFENVDSRFKFVVLTFEKCGEEVSLSTKSFPAAFMRHDVSELAAFPREGAIELSVEAIRRLSPDSLSVMEFKTPLDVVVAEKMLRCPLLGDAIGNAWNVRFTREFDMTNDSHLFKTSPGNGRLQLYEGKMIHQFTHTLAAPRYWVDEAEGRAACLKRGEEDAGQTMAYQSCRLGFRDIARNTDERTLISTVIPPLVFCGNTVPVTLAPKDSKQLLFITSVLNAFVADWFMRQRVTCHCSFFYMNQLPVPRLTAKDAAFRPIVERSAKLVCTAPEFDVLAKEVFGGRALSKTVGVTEPYERAQLRAELDALVGHLYGLTETEFAHILSTFPLVPDPVKIAAHNAFRNVEKGLIK